MATQPQSTYHAPVNTPLRRTSVYNLYIHPDLWKEKEVSEQKVTRAKAHRYAPISLPGPPLPTPNIPAKLLH